MTEDPALSVTVACEILEINPRAYYRWIKEPLSNPSGGGGKNKVTPLEEKRVVAMAKKILNGTAVRLLINLKRKLRFSLVKRKLQRL